MNYSTEKLPIPDDVFPDLLRGEESLETHRLESPYQTAVS
jgi:hypothetical protein